MFYLFKGRTRFACDIMLWEDGSRGMFDRVVGGLQGAKLSTLQNRDGYGE